MILGLKCEGCKMWTRLDTIGVFAMLLAAKVNKLNQPYYCDECKENVTYHETKATITLNE